MGLICTNCSLVLACCLGVSGTESLLVIPLVLFKFATLLQCWNNGNEGFKTPDKVLCWCCKENILLSESFALSWLFFLMVQGFPSLAINCMQILFLCVCLCMTVCVCECVCVSSEAKPKREAVPLKQNWKKCLQASYYSGMSQGSGFAAQLYKPSRIWLIWPVCLTVKRFFHTHTHTHTHTELGITTSLSFDRTATKSEADSWL